MSIGVPPIKSQLPARNEMAVWTSPWANWFMDIFKNLNGIITPETSVTPTNNGDIVFEFTNNTTLTIKGRETDGTVRSTTLTLS